MSERLTIMLDVLKYSYPRYGKRLPRDDYLIAQARTYAKDLFEIADDKLGEAFTLAYHKLDGTFIPTSKQVLELWRSYHPSPTNQFSLCSECTNGLRACFKEESAPNGRVYLKAMRCACTCPKGDAWTQSERPLLQFGSVKFMNNGFMGSEEARSWTSPEKILELELLKEEEALKEKDNLSHNCVDNRNTESSIHEHEDNKE